MKRVILLILSVVVLGFGAGKTVGKNKSVKEDTYHITKKTLAYIKRSGLIANNKKSYIQLKAFSNVYGEFLSQKYGRLQNTAVNLRLPSGMITNNLTWANIVYKTLVYLRNAKDEYDYFYRVYKLTSLRFFLVKGKNGNAVVSQAENPYYLTALFTSTFIEKQKGGTPLRGIIMFYDAGPGSFVRKAYISWILFAGSSLNKLSNSSYAAKYFKQFEPGWEYMRDILIKIKNEEMKNDKR